MLASYHDELDASLAQFIGNLASVDVQLRQDLSRFSFLLGVTAGERLFGIE